MSSRVELTEGPESSSESIAAADVAIQKTELAQNFQAGLEGGITTQVNKVSRRSRLLKLGAFVLIELLWLGFGLFVGLRAEKLKIRTLTFFNFEVDSEQISQSTLSFIAGLYQTAALVFPGAIVADVYASEWYHLLHSTTTGTVDKMKVDKVSLLTAGAVERLKHLADRKRSSKAFSLAIFVSMLLIPLHSMMISTVTLGPAFVGNNTEITIGTLPAISTFGEGIGGTDENARNLQVATRDAYISGVTGAFLDVVCINSPNRS